MILPRQVPLAEAAKIAFERDEEIEVQSRVLKARHIHAGYLDPDLAADIVENFLGSEVADMNTALNLSRIANNALTKRITLTGFKPIDAIAETTGDDLLELARTINFWWKYLRFPVLARNLTEAVIRDGEAFLLLEYDPEWENVRLPNQKGIPRIYMHERFVSVDATFKDEIGTGEGCRAFYRNDDRMQPLEMVAKRWTEATIVDGEIVETPRMTLYINALGNPQLDDDYTPPRIEKYAQDDEGAWAQYKDPQDTEWPIYWTEGFTDSGLPLPLPVIHFTNEDMVPTQYHVWGLQTITDQIIASLSNAAVLSGQQILAAFGFNPTTDGRPINATGSNIIKLRPRTIIGDNSKGPRDAGVTVIESGNLAPLISSIDKIAMWTAFTQGLPVSNFVFSEDPQAADTLRQGEAELVARANDLISLFNQSWSETTDAMLAYHRVIGKANISETVYLENNWAPIERRDANIGLKEAELGLKVGRPLIELLQDIYGLTAEEAEDALKTTEEEIQRGLRPSMATQTPGEQTGASVTDTEVNTNG